ncbi:class I SAM-dependent methyltransferase [Cohnella nanjingensis]|uniref:Class I SAM-dependent methyltransferase n=1 Tax=Cohnella nanjingensis TaxID=1387779 RepID=A0A7X0RWR8_9BACL|nr:class I SAM-dependent methyltransferase [Cohnella nanjingensis]MBB6673891.1 class I SAM-dependent methyltransferase [Cohnella nanjingensis]
MNKEIPAYPQSGVASTCRSYDEYLQMFNLTEERLREGPVLDAAGGASSFTAALCALGLDARAADPFYGGDREAVISAAEAEIGVSSAKLEANRAFYDWSYYGSPERHRALREASCARFAGHFRSDEGNGRYAAAALPNLPYADGTFSLALCSHFLFLYADQFGPEFHEAALRELLRVVKPGGEVRIYPLISLRWEPYAHLPGLLEALGELAEASEMPGRLPFVPVQSPVLRLVRR